MSLALSHRRLLSLSLFFVCATMVASGQVNLQLDKVKIVLNPNQEIEIIATGSTILDLDKLKWTYNRDLLDITVTEQNGSLNSAIKAKDKAIQSLFIYANYNGSEIRQVEVTILPALKGEELQFSPALKDVVVQNQILEFTITAGNTFIDPAITKVQVTPND